MPTRELRKQLHHLPALLCLHSIVTRAARWYSCLHFPFSGANPPSTLSSACRYLPTISSSSAVRCRSILVDFLEIIPYASSFPFPPSIHVHHFSSASRFGVHAPSLSARSNMTLSVGLGIFGVYVTHGLLWVAICPIFEVFPPFPHLWAKFVTPSRATPPFGPSSKGDFGIVLQSLGTT